MRILFTLTYYYPHWTGLTEHAKRLAEALAEKKHTVRVVTTQHEENLKRKETIRQVEVERLPIWFRLSRTLVSPAFIFRSWQEIGNSDVVIVYTPIAEVLLLALFAKVQGKRLIVIHNGDLILPRGFINRCIEIIFDISTLISGMLADTIIAYSDDYARFSRFLRHFPKKTVPILPLFPNKHVDTAIKSKIKQRMPQKHQPIIGFAGRFVEEKGFDILLRAIPIVIHTYPHALFVFAGETHMVYEQFFEKNKQLLTRVQPYFYSFGLLSQTEMRGFYDLLDVFVLPSRSDCLAFVQVEAMLSGIPVIVTDIPGARVAVLKTGMGELVATEKPEALAKGIITVLKEKERYRKKKINAEELFDYKSTVNQFLEVIVG